jgi:hypothetical protein
MQKDIKAIFNLNGKRIKSLVSVPMYTKVLIASTEKEFIGIRGISKLMSNIDSLSLRETGMGV